MEPRHSRADITNTDKVHQAKIRSERPPQVMVVDSKAWALYIHEGADDPEPLDSMKDLFTRYRTVLDKATNHTYTDDALQRSWCAFFRRWNASRR